jgi:HAMP domain-containing protein
MLDHQLLTVFVLACLALLALVCGFFIKAWIENLGKSINELSHNVHDMTEVISELKQEQAVQRERIRQQAAQIRQLQEIRGCTKPDCQFRTQHMHTRFTDDTLPALTPQSGDDDAFAD